MQEVCSSLDPQLGPQIKSEPPISAIQGKLVNNCDKRMDPSAYWMSVGAGTPNSNGSIGPTEGGFINSEPSIAEFMTHLDPESPKIVGNQVYGDPSDQMDGVREYAWMKEKKTARKNNNSQGKSLMD